jgi:hypothetical protein
MRATRASAPVAVRRDAAASRQAGEQKHEGRSEVLSHAPHDHTKRQIFESDRRPRPFLASMKRERLIASLRIVTPCPVAWSSMRGDDFVRFCDRCRKNVYNVAALGPDETISLLERKEGPACLLLTRRADGTVVTGDCWSQLRRARKRGLTALALAAPVILATQLWSQAFGLRALLSFFRGDPPPAVAAGAPQPLAGDPILPPPRPEPRVTAGVPPPFSELRPLRHAKPPRPAPSKR